MLLLGAPLAGVSAADEPTAGPTAGAILTVEQALGEVEDVNLAILTNREFIAQSEEVARLARSSLLPQVNLSASQSRGDRRRAGLGSIANSFEAGVFGSMVVLDFQQHDTLRAARKAVEVSKYDYEAAVQQVMAAVATVYFQHLRNLAFDKVIDSNIERAQALLDLARNRLEAGVATQIDITRAEAELVTQQQAKLQQGTVIRDSALQLQRLLNVPLGGTLELDEFRVRREIDATLRAISLDAVLDRRPDYQAQALAIEQAQLSRRAAGRERAPTVDVFAQGGVASEIVLDGDEDKFWSFGARVNMPVFEGQRIRANERLAESRLRQESLRLADLRSQIGVELSIAMQDVESQLAQIGVAEKNLSLAQEELRLARVRYEQGVADNREMIDAENRFTSTSFNLVNAIFSYHLARLELARVRGDVRLILSERETTTTATL
jgi:outer membrane protein TolC